MKTIIYLLVIIQFILFLPVSAQQKNSPGNVPVTNEKQVVHKIVKGETIYSICKKYDIDEKELRKANPQLNDGLKNGLTLIIPLKSKNEDKKAQENKTQKFISHTVKKGETLFSISRKLHVTVDEIKEYNPEVKDGCKAGQILRIPVEQEKTNAKESTPVKTEKPKTEEKAPAPKEQSDKTTYIQHEIEQGETFYSLQRRYELTQDQLIELNPSLKNGLQVGEVIKLPSVVNNSAKENRNEYFEYEVEQGETVYSIASHYKVKTEEIYEMNPELKERGLISGETIIIPKTSNPIFSEAKNENKEIKKDPEEVASKEASKAPSPSSFKKTYPNLNKDEFRITMFLPLYLNKNEALNSTGSSSNDDTVTDTTTIAAIGDDQNSSNYGSLQRSLYSHSRNFLCFYEGFLLALDTMKKCGINIRLDLYDNQMKQTVVDSVIRHTDLVNTDLIIGPIDTKHQKNLSYFSFKNQIPMISPLSSDDDYALTNPYYYQINPTRDYILRKTADYIGREYFNKNIIIFTPSSHEQIKGADLIETVRDKVKYYSSKKKSSSKGFTIININDGYWELKKYLKPDEENIVFIPPSTNKTEREAILSRAINSLYVLSEEFKITLIGMSEYPSFKSINIEYFHKLNLHYASPNYIDYQDQEVKWFVKEYRKQFLTEPNQFSYRGYDIAKFYLEAYREYGSNFSNKVGSVRTNTLQSEFKFKRVKDLAGFMNSSLFILNYTPEYEIKIASIISE